MNRSYISLPQFIVEVISYLIILGSLIAGIIIATSTTGEIPVHYDLAGNVDGYGSPYVMLIMPLAMLLCSILISVCSHFSNPAKWNMPFRVKPGNELIVYHDFVWSYVIIQMLFSIMSLAFVIFLPKSGNALFVVTMSMCVMLIPGIVVPSIMAKKHNV